MTSFSPFTILHLQLDQLEGLVLPAGRHYLVCWWKELPLAHIWWEGSEGASLSDRLRKALTPALRHYLQPDNPVQLEKGEYGQLALRLEQKYGQEGAFPAGKGKRERISVVICTRNRPAALKECLLSLRACTDQDFELLVVDNASDDERTASVVAQFPGVIYIAEKRKGLDIARNTGARYASHSIIAYTDDDVKIPVNWIGALKTCFADPLTMAVTGLVIPFELQTAAQVVFERDWGFNKGYLPKIFDHRYFLDNLAAGVPAWDIGAGANMAFRKQAFQLAGWFDERLDVGAAGCSGDSEMWYRILAEGWNCVYYPHVYVFHQHRRSTTELHNQLFQYMRGHVCALLVQYENYGHKGNLSRLYKGFPLYYYYRFKNKLLSRGLHNHGAGRGMEEGARDNSSLWREIKGCFSGWKYYRHNRDRKRQDIYSFPEHLRSEVTVNEDSLVTVIIPCYNQGRFLRQAVESVLEQTHKNWEVIIVDDGSQDETPAVAAAFRANYEERIKYVRVERVGLPAARNIGVQFASGDFLVFLDADDFLYSSALELNLYYFGFYRSPVFVSGGHIRVDETGNLLPGAVNRVKGSDHYRSLLEGNYIGMEGTVMYRREVFFHFHFDTALSSCEDLDLNIRIARYFPVFSHAGIIAAYRIHPGNMSGDRSRMLKTAIAVLKKQEPGLSNDEERMAYRMGLVNWQEYYSGKTQVPPLPPVLPMPSMSQMPSNDNSVMAVNSRNERIPSSPPNIEPVTTGGARPLWSVMIPVYNCGTYLKQTLESVLAQDPGPEKMQIEVVDDASTDMDVATFVAVVGKGRVGYYRQPENRGSLRNFETCVNRARGQLVHLLHGDDYIGNGFYTAIGDLFARFPEAGAAYTGFYHVGEKGEPLYPNETVMHEPGIIADWLTIIAQGQKIQPPAMVVKREVYERLGSFFGVHYGEDWEMWVRIAAHYPVAHSPECLAYYRIHNENISSRYFLSGQHLRDIASVIDTIQHYIPPDRRAILHNAAKRNWSHYFARTSDMVYDRFKSPQQALRQAIMAYRLHRNRVSFFYVVKTCAKKLLRYRR